MAPRPLIAGNWKMHLTLVEAGKLVDALGALMLEAPDKPACDIVVCPPFTLLAPLSIACQKYGFGLGGQDCHAEEMGAFTGNVAAPMLADIGCSHVIVGHSERRSLQGETDAMVKAKAEAALAAGLVAIVCVGETEAERDSGKAEEIVVGQLLASLPQGATAGNTVIAYEPVWAIGTGRTPSVEQVAAMHKAIRTALAGPVAEAAGMRILYGGSVKPGNARELLAVENVDGALVGGASLVPADFWAICTSCT
ncbi:MAG: triose-phosphate isomerase [Alphaproteobacteria bacterium]|nr:triose-phosphate isomerase [Alphaproteobacteria bacterium]